MKRIRFVIAVFAACLSCFASFSQAIWGNITNGENFLPLFGVAVTNLVTDQTVHTDADGHYAIRAKFGDSLAFSLAGFHGASRRVVGSQLDVDMYPMSYKLPEFTVLTPFQRDSIELTTLYSHELNKRPIKTGFSSANGGGFTGLIGGPVQKISRSYKQTKRFQENFRQDMEQRYIDTRYTPVLVASLTPLAGDSVIYFINTHPMDYQFARRATDLELKAWIRDTYKEYLKATAARK